jgi:Galactose oxidase, central domain
MKSSLLLAISICTLCVLTACGSGAHGGSQTATHFAVAAPATATAGMAVRLMVTALDATNNVVTGYSGTVHFASTDGQAALPANSTLTTGTGTFSVTLKTVGGQTITATDTIAGSITGTSMSISVIAVGATHFSVIVPTTATAGTAISLSVNALDASNNMVTSYSGTAHFTSTDAQATLPANSTLTNGTAIFPATMKTAGNQTITVTDEATASITGTSNSIYVIPAGGMETPRQAHMATMLNTGKVLVTGGAENRRGSLATAELYDPNTGTFTTTGTMETGRAGHTATLLVDGRVLVTGGTENIKTALATAELYDPNTGSFTATGTMEIGRESHTATLLNSGKVLVTGGMDSSGTALATAELYDPNTGSFTATGTMEIGRESHTATLLNSGKVLVTGGMDNSGTALATAELYDPNTGSFTATGNMETARARHTATLISGGMVLVTGGIDGLGFDLPSAEMFDPANGAFTPTGSMETAREYHTATLRKDGRVLVAGGAALVLAPCGNNCSSVAPVSLSKCELFDPATKTFTGTGDLGTARFLHTATLLSEGSVLVTGGADSRVIGEQLVSTVLSTTELLQ